MKKYILSGVVIVALIGYFLYSKMGGEVKPISNTVPTSTTTEPVSLPVASGKNKYKDGTYVGDNIKFLYGNIQASVVIKDGGIADINFLVYPKDNPTSTKINENAIPLWRTEIIKTQQTKVSIASQATDSGVALTESLDSALVLALNN